MTTADMLQEFDEDDLFVGYNPVMPMKIFGYELEPSECEIYISSKLHITEIVPALSQHFYNVRGLWCGYQLWGKYAARPCY